MGEYGKKWAKEEHGDEGYIPSIKEVITGLNLFWNKRI